MSFCFLKRFICDRCGESVDITQPAGNSWPDTPEDWIWIQQRDRKEVCFCRSCSTSLHDWLHNPSSDKPIGAA
jgi:hypothetical protein